MSPQFDRPGLQASTVEALSRFKKEPSWMTELRLKAWEAYQQAPLPESELHGIHPFTLPPMVPVPSRDWPTELQHAMDERGDEEGLIVQRDSTILSRSITKEHSKKGVIFTDLDSALQNVPELVQSYFGRLVKPETPAEALQAAFWSGGTFLYVPPNLNITLPFHTCLWMSTPEAGIFSHNLVVVEDNSRVSFIDECISGDWNRPGLMVEVLEVFVAAQAQVKCFHLQHCGQGVRHYREEKSQVASTGELKIDRLEQRPNTSLERAAELYPEIRH
jgi:Fe-S cluster assembly protein SufB